MNIMDHTVRPQSPTASSDQALPTAYEPPRILTHSARDLDGMILHVNACTSGFGGDKSAKEDDDKGSVVY